MSRAPIAINAAFVGDTPTGLGVYAVSVAHALAARGERLIVYTSRPDLFAVPGIEARTVPELFQFERGVPGHLARLAWIQTRLRRRLDRDGASLLLNVMPEGVIGSSVPQITTVHDLVPLRFPRDYRRKVRYFRHYVPALLRSSLAVIADSESTRRDVLQFYPSIAPATVRVVVPAYDARRFNLDGPTASDTDDAYALYVGNMLPHKNVHRIVEAFAAVARRTSARLALRGYGWARTVNALKRRIGELGLEDRVDWQPYVAADRLAMLYRGARVLLLPSLCEGHGFPVLEAMACGTPVIAANTSSLPALCGDAAVLVDPLDVDALAEAMVQVLTDDTLVKTLRDRGLERMRHFSWHRTAEEIQHVIAETLEGKSH